MAEAQFNLVNCIKSAFYVHTQNVYAMLRVSGKRISLHKLGQYIKLHFYVFASWYDSLLSCIEQPASLQTAKMV
jgi:hypothetical protein